MSWKMIGQPKGRSLLVMDHLKIMLTSPFLYLQKSENVYIQQNISGPVGFLPPTLNIITDVRQRNINY